MSDGNPNFANYDISQDRYISRATRNPPSHFDWETWRKIGQPGQYAFPPGHTAQWSVPRTGAGPADYLNAGTHYNMFENLASAGAGVSREVYQLRQALRNSKGSASGKMKSNSSATSGNGANMSGLGRSQSVSITGDSGSRNMRRGRGDGMTFADMSSNLGITMNQGSDVYGDNYGQVMGGVSGTVNAPFQSGNIGGTFSTGPNRNVITPPPPPPASGAGFPPPPPPPSAGVAARKPRATQPTAPRTPFTPSPGVTPGFPAPGLKPMQQNPIGPQTPVAGPQLNPQGGMGRKKYGPRQPLLSPTNPLTQIGATPSRSRGLNTLIPPSTPGAYTI